MLGGRDALDLSGRARGVREVDLGRVGSDGHAGLEWGGVMMGGRQPGGGRERVRGWAGPLALTTVAEQPEWGCLASVYDP